MRSVLLTLIIFFETVFDFSLTMIGFFVTVVVIDFGFPFLSVLTVFVCAFKPIAHNPNIKQTLKAETTIQLTDCDKA